MVGLAVWHAWDLVLKIAERVCHTTTIIIFFSSFYEPGTGHFYICVIIIYGFASSKQICRVFFFVFFSLLLLLDAGARCAVCVKHCLYLVLFLIWRFFFFSCTFHAQLWSSLSLFNQRLKHDCGFLIVVFHSFRATFTVFRHSHTSVVVVPPPSFFPLLSVHANKTIWFVIFNEKLVDALRFYYGALKLFLEFGYVVFSVSPTTCIVCVLRSLADYYCFFFWIGWVFK